MVLQLSEPPLYETLNEHMYRLNAERVVRESMLLAVPAQKVHILDWCEQNFVEPRSGIPYSRRSQPATALLLDLLNSDYWRSCMLVAPNQAGKSFTLAQYLFHVLFNLREDVVYGVPDLDGMWRTKWLKDILPFIEASALRHMIPKGGSGSDGGVPKLVLWNNHTTLTPMGAGGGDSQRAGATSRVVLITEVKDFGKTKGGSKEGTPYDQLVRRALRHMGREFIFSESTITTASNLAWQMYLQGTQTVPHFPCESCEEYIAPEREHLIGWQDARTEEEAREKTMFTCPVCGILIDDAKRRRLLQEAKALHAGQTVDRGRVIGDPPPTRALSFRFTASTNMFAESGAIGVMEWKKVREQLAQRRSEREVELTQSIFAMPGSAFGFNVDPLDSNVLMRRAVGTEIGIVPSGMTHLWGGVDVRKTAMHWTVIASGEGVAPKIIAWGEQPVLQDMPLERAIPYAAACIQEIMREGFPFEESKDRLPVMLTLMDAGWRPQDVYAACDQDDFWIPVRGLGSGCLKKEAYKEPDKTSNVVRFIGDGFHVKFMDDRFVVQSNASVYKSKLHQALREPLNSLQAMTFAKSDQFRLRKLVRHLTAEKEVITGDSGVTASEWEEQHDDNHLLDSTSYANLARFVWLFLQDILAEDDTDSHTYTVAGSGPLFG